MAAEEKERVNWVRGPKKVDSRNVSLEDAIEAEKRGINVEVNADNPAQSVVTKTVIEGMPAPKKTKQ